MMEESILNILEITPLGTINFDTSPSFIVFNANSQISILNPFPTISSIGLGRTP